MSRRLRGLRIALGTLSVVGVILTMVGLVVAAAIKTDRLSERVLRHYPRYQLALGGFETLRARAHTIRDIDVDKDVAIGVLTITDPGWHVILDFIRSETAVRKSARNDPTFSQWIPRLPKVPSAEGKASTPSPPGSNPPAPVKIPDVDFTRIKTIICAKLDVVAAGDKPLLPPYRLAVFWPNNIPRHMYEFVSFDEFLFDLRHMMLAELETGSLWLSAAAFALSVLTSATRWGIGRHRQVQDSE